MKMHMTPTDDGVKEYGKHYRSLVDFEREHLELLENHNCSSIWPSSSLEKLCFLFFVKQNLKNISL